MSISCDDSEYPEVERHGMRRARLAHKCSACRETIRPGDWHYYAFWVFEATAETIRRCLRCESIYRVLREKLRPDDEFPEPSLDCGHTWQERYGEEPPPEIARLAFMTADEVQAEGAKLPGLGVENG